MKTLIITLAVLITLTTCVPATSYSIGLPGSRKTVKVLNKKRKLSKETSFYSLKFHQYNYMKKKSLFAFLTDNRRHIY